MLTNVFSPNDCARCKLCCNFRRVSAWETPALQDSQIFLMHEAGVPLEKRPDGTTSFYLHFETESEEEVVNCPMLNPCSGCMLPRESRPFECRIWPVRIMKSQGRLVLGIYKDCPALNGDTFEKLKNHTLEKLLPEILAYGRRHPQAVRDYNSLYSIIWEDK